MAAKINLLPRDYEAGKGMGQAGRVLSYLAVFITVLLLIVGAGGGAYIYYLNGEVDRLEREEETLITSINTLESTEQQLVLVKDRLLKIQGVLAERTQESLFDKQNTLIESLPEETAFISSEVRANNSEVSLESTSSLELLQLFNDFTSSSLYTQVIMQSLRYSDLNGFSFDLSIL